MQQNVGNLTCSAKCLLGAANVQILQWPPETNVTTANDAPMTAAPMPSGIVSTGVTFISPSVYIAYHDLQAFISCPGSTGFIKRGNSYNTTIAYAPQDLSASISARARQTCAFSEIDYTKLANYPFSNATDYILSLPTALSSIDPAWSTYAPASYGAFDPPRTLQKATALTDPIIESTSSTQATPGGSAGLVHGPPTVTSSATSSGLEVPSAAFRLAAPHTSDLPGIQSAQPVDPAIGQSSYNSATSESLLDTRPRVSHVEGPKTDPDDPSKVSPVPSKNRADEGDRRENKPNARSETSTVPTPGKLGPDRTDPIKNKQSASPGEPKAIVGPNTELRSSSVSLDPPMVGGRPTVQALNRGAILGAATYTSGSVSHKSKVPLPVRSSSNHLPDSGYALLTHEHSTPRASNGETVIRASSIDPASQAMVSGNPISPGVFDAQIGGSTGLVPTRTAVELSQKPSTLNSETLVSPGSSANDFRIGSQIISFDGEAVVVFSDVVSLDSSALNVDGSRPPLLPATRMPNATAVSSGLTMSPLDPGRSPANAGSNGSTSVGYAEGRNGSITKVFTGGSRSSGDDCLTPILVLLAMAIMAMQF